VDFRVESNGYANMLFVDGGNNTVGINEASNTRAFFQVTADVAVAADACRLEGDSANNIPLVLDNVRADAASEHTIQFFRNGSRFAAIGGTDTSLQFFHASAVTMTIDSTGAITKPLQPCVQVKCGSTQSNTSSPHDIEFDTEIFDQNADFNTTTFTFTAPVTGRYLVLISAQLQDITTDPDYFQYNIVTSNRSYNATMDNGVFAATAVYFPLQFQVIADMDASDTLVANLVYESETTIEVLAETYLSISLLC